jgi:hypothetical protein
VNGLSRPSGGSAWPGHDAAIVVTAAGPWPKSTQRYKGDDMLSFRQYINGELVEGKGD